MIKSSLHYADRQQFGFSVVYLILMTVILADITRPLFLLLEQPGTLRTNIDLLFIYHQTPISGGSRIWPKEGGVDFVNGGRGGGGVENHWKCWKLK